MNNARIKRSLSYKQALKKRECALVTRMPLYDIESRTSRRDTGALNRRCVHTDLKSIFVRISCSKRRDSYVYIIVVFDFDETIYLSVYCTI